MSFSQQRSNFSHWFTNRYIDWILDSDLLSKELATPIFDFGSKKGVANSNDYSNDDEKWIKKNEFSGIDFIHFVVQICDD